MDWTRPYQVPPHLAGSAKQKHRELMLRPKYPLVYKEKQMPHVSDISEVAVIVDDAWKVGDLVDWLSTDCYWSGRIIQLLGDGKAQIELFPEPLGEGSIYEVLLKDIRPSLDWSLENGWMVPTQDGDTGKPCVRLIQPLSTVMKTKTASQQTKGLTCSSVEPSFSAPLSANSIAVSDELRSTGSMDMKQSLDNTVCKEATDAETITSPNVELHSTKKTSGVDVNPGKMSAEPAAKVLEKEPDCTCPPKFRTSGGLTLNSMCSDTIEAAIMDLEEYINKIKWLKMILLNGISSPDAPRLKWEFVDQNAASSRPK